MTWSLSEREDIIRVYFVVRRAYEACGYISSPKDRLSTMTVILGEALSVASYRDFNAGSKHVRLLQPL